MRNDATNFMELVKIIHNHLTFDVGREVLGVKDADLDWWEDAWAKIQSKGIIGLSCLDNDNLKKIYHWAKTKQVVGFVVKAGVCVKP